MFDLALTRKVVTKLTGVAFVAAGLRVSYFAYLNDLSIFGTAACAGSLLLLGGGLIASYFWARQLTAAILGASALVAVLGYVNPFAAMDTPRPDYIAGLYWLVAIVGVQVLTAWLVAPASPPRTNTPLAT